MPDMGQVTGTDHLPVADMEYASTGHPLQLYLRTGPKLSMVQRITHTDTTAIDQYNSGCLEPPLGAFPQCNPEGGNQFSFPFFENTNDGYWFIMQLNVADWELVWSSSLGDLEPTDVSADALGNVYVTGVGYQYAQLPLMDHPDYYSSTLPGTGEWTVVLGFSPSGQFWGSYHGDHDNRFAVASRTNDRIYIAGSRGLHGFVPYNCPWGVVEPWCVQDAAVSGICYSQLKETLPVGFTENTGPALPSVTCYPNPAHGEVMITGLPQDGTAFNCTVSDATGRRCRALLLSPVNGAALLPLQGLGPGLYQAQLSAVGGPSFRTSFMIAP